MAVMQLNPPFKVPHYTHFMILWHGVKQIVTHVHDERILYNVYSKLNHLFHRAK